MSKRFVYLAGPVLGCTDSEANDWRELTANDLAEHGIVGISPLRCEPPHGVVYTNANPDPLFGVASGIMAKNMFDVKTCDMVLAYLPGHHPLSVGTIAEIAWARAFDKPVILVTLQTIAEHPVVKGMVGWTVPYLDQGVEIAVGILAGYVGGKNV